MIEYVIPVDRQANKRNNTIHNTHRWVPVLFLLIWISKSKYKIQKYFHFSNVGTCMS